MRSWVEADQCDLAARFPISLNGVQARQVLERAGLVQREVCGREHQLQLWPSPWEANAVAAISGLRARGSTPWNGSWANRPPENAGRGFTTKKERSRG
jgi:hypothetical protein